MGIDRELVNSRSYFDYLCPLMPSGSEVAGVARGSVGV